MEPGADCHVWPKVWSLLPPTLLTDAVLGVARSAVSEGDYSRLPILADALEEAGCDRADVLEHLRRAGPHEVGCWALHQIVLTNRPYQRIEPPPSPPLPLPLEPRSPWVSPYRGSRMTKAERDWNPFFIFGILAAWLFILFVAAKNSQSVSPPTTTPALKW